MFASGCAALTASLSRTRWSFGTLETHPAECCSRDGGAGSVPARTDRRRRAEIFAATEARRDSPQENRRQVLVLLPARVLLVFSYWRRAHPCHHWHTLCPSFTANAAAP